MNYHVGIRERAAAIASTGNGLPQEQFVVLAAVILTNLAGYRHRSVTEQQDLDYLARMLQAVVIDTSLSE